MTSKKRTRFALCALSRISDVWSRFPKKAVLAPVCTIAFATFASGATITRYHATLLRSTPAAKSRITTPPEAIRLVFSEEVVAELSQISLVAADRTVSLKVANDPHDVRTLLGRVDGALPGGSYKVVWRVLSADGHPVNGEFDFVLAGAGSAVGSASTTPTEPPAPAETNNPNASHTHAPTPPTGDKPVPIAASLLRGLGLGSLMAGIGLLFFGLTSREHAHLAARSMVSRAITAGGLLLVIHALMWMRHIAPGGNPSAVFVGSLLSSTVGRIELVRTALAVLAVLAIGLAHHQKLAFTLGAACLVVSGAIGHPAAIDPYWAIPAKIVHLLAGSLWVGGLIWLLWLARCDDAACRVEARRVSSLALISVIVIALSGVLQAFLFLNHPADLLRSTYGQLVVAKAVGLAVLIGFGAYNRFGLLPALDAADGPGKLAKSVRWEIAVVTVVILIGGFLAYVPTPPLSASTASAPTMGGLR